jgi:DNA-directed RNA polymerase subunit beta'
MAVHVPLSLEAQIESRVLMMATNNILSPSNGEPVIVPSKDIVLGLYYLTLSRAGEKGEGRMFSDLNEVLYALQEKTISLHAKIITRYADVDADGHTRMVRCETSAGRMILWDSVPRHPQISFDSVNKTFTSKDVTQLVSAVHRYCGSTKTVEFADKLVQIGFRHATSAGISFGKDDLIVPGKKAEFVKETLDSVNEYQQQYLDGLITPGERYNKVTDAWTKCTERVAEAMMVEIAKDIPGKPLNSVYMMAHSGARGSAAQMKQLAAMRGLIARHDGTIIEHPIISNFKEGLKAFE